MMMRVLVASGLVLAACGNDNGGAPNGMMMNTDGGMTQCSVEPTFSSLHDGLFMTTRCAIPGCHAADNSGGMLNFESGAQGVYDLLVGGATNNANASAQFPTRVVASDQANSYLYVKVSQVDPPGGMFGRMPPGPPLEDCEIQAIGDWIAAGAAND